jgi:hypothetical protein
VNYPIHLKLCHYLPVLLEKANKGYTQCMEVAQERDDRREDLNHLISMYTSEACQIDTLNNILEEQSRRKIVCGTDVSDEAIHKFLEC